MNIKKGDVLRQKNGLGSRRVLAVLEDVALLSSVDDYDSAYALHTFTQIEKYFDLPKEEWRPGVGDDYFFVNDKGEIWTMEFNIDHGRIAVGNCYKTREEAEAALERVKKAYRG